MSIMKDEIGRRGWRGKKLVAMRDPQEIPHLDIPG
jgi:hypothetical protein